MSDTSHDDEPQQAARTTPDTPTDDLGEAGKKALKAERDARTAAERQLRVLQAQYDEATSRIGSFETQIGDLTSQVTERDLANIRLTVGLEKGLPKALVDRLKGTTPEEIAADADELAQLLPAPAPAGSGTNLPRADPSQGSRGTGKTPVADQFANAIQSAFN